MQVNAINQPNKSNQFTSLASFAKLSFFKSLKVLVFFTILHLPTKQQSFPFFFFKVTIMNKNRKSHS